MPDALSVEHLTVTLHGRTILDDVSFSIQPGEFTGLIGSNGVGKTTLLRAILGLQPYETGTISVNGEPRDLQHAAIGYVPQKIALDSDVPLRVIDFVTLGLDAERWGLRRRSAAQRDRVAALLEAVGAAHLATKRLSELSGGEQQRVFIAHALVREPSLLLLDEPLASLDPRNVQEIVALLHRLAHEHHVAILLSAHEMNALLPVMDRVVYLTGGHCASGSTNEVVQTDVLSALYGHHVDVLQVHGRVFVIAEPNDATDNLPEHPTLTVH
jgi:zinc/manganese transport system ATP-binding protein